MASCLDCGEWLKDVREWFCEPCTDKWVEIGKKTEEAMKNDKRIRANRQKRSDSKA